MDSESNCSFKDPGKARVACLYSIADLQEKCQSSKVKLSSETNRYMVYLTLRRLGALTAQKLIKKLVDRGDFSWNQEEDFEVEAILDHGLDERDNNMYLVKWKGWSHAHNTWEPDSNLTGCEELLTEYHLTHSKVSKTRLKKHYVQQQMSRKPDSYCGGKSQIDDIFARISESKPSMTPLELLSLHSPTKKKSLLHTRRRMCRLSNRSSVITNKRSNAYKKLKKEQEEALKQWESHLNNINKDPAKIFVENNVDLEGPPDKFIFITDYKEGPGITIPNDPIIGCECVDCFATKKDCCGTNAGSVFAYYRKGKVRVPPGTPIYECNKRCKCGPSCDNRVVQHGRKHKVCVFRTENRGWGVKAMQPIKKGSFVMEYVGEVISNEEAERRGKDYDMECRTYLFDLDFEDCDCPFTVDAGIYGNVSHFVNHSCEPNLAVYVVWINNLDPRLPRIALFAQRDIAKDEELTFDYMMTGDTTGREAVAMEMDQPAEAAAGNPLIDASQNFKTPVMISKKVTSPGKENTMLESSVPDIENSESSSGAKVSLDTHLDAISSQGSELLESTLGAGESSEMDVDEDLEDSNAPNILFSATSPFFRRKITSPSPAMKNRIICQCGSKMCRKYLF